MGRAKKTTTTTRTKAKPKAKAGEDALLRAICADPSNIEDRLVYADQLSDNGDPRGAFISAQLAIEEVEVFDERYPKMLAAIERLEARHAREWLAGFLDRVKIKPAHFAQIEINERLNAVFERGFLKRIAMNPLDIKKHWDWLAEREPIEGVEVLVGEGLTDEERAIKGPPKLRSLKVSPDGWFTSRSIGDIFGWGIPNVHEIDLSRCDLGADGCRLLANIEMFSKGQIKRLVLHTCQIGDAGACVLFDANPLDGLVELDIGQCRLREKSTLTALRDAARMKKITRLSIAGNNDLKGKIDALAGWEALPRLTKIALPQAVSAKEVKALFPSASTALRELDVSSARDLMKTPSAIQIAAALSRLDIGTTSIGTEGFTVLLKTPMIEKVIDLQANGCSLSDEAIEVLCSSKLRRLVHLDLSSNKLTDAALARLAEWPGIEHVTSLRVGNNRKLTSKGYDALMKSARFQPASFDIGKQSDTKLVANLRKRFGADVVLTS